MSAPVPPAVRRVLGGIAFSALGNGLVLPFLVIYLHEVRGMSLEIAGLVLSTFGVVGLVAVPVAGMLVDRIGSRRVLVASLSLQLVGYALVAIVHVPWQAFAVAAVFGSGNAAYWPATTSMLSRLVPAESRTRVFGVQFALLNAGIGIGGIIGGFVVHVDHPGTFEAIYLLDALTFLPLLVVLLSMRTTLPPPAKNTDDGSYREVFRDRAFRRVALVSTVLVLVGYSQLDSGLPPFARDVGQVSTRVIGFAFATNTAMIVAGQLLVLRRLEGHRRSSALALVALIWGGSWLILGSAGLVPPGILRALLICTCAAVFGLGETLFSPVNPAITNDLAPERLRGRYNAVTSLTWNVAFSLGPAFAGLLLGRDLPAVWVAILVGGCLVAAVLARTLDGVLTPEQNGVRPAGRPSEVLPAVPAAASIGGTGANPKP